MHIVDIYKRILKKIRNLPPKKTVLGPIRDESYAEKKKKILDEAFLHHCVSLEQLLSPKRTKNLVLARRKIIRRLRNELGMSLPEIGRVLGRDHTTILYHLQHED